MMAPTIPFSELYSLLALFSVVALLFLTLALYRLFFHPLAGFPGPKLAAITRFYEAYYDVVQNGQYTFKISQLHKEYGPIVRISPHELHIDDPAFYEKLYRHDGHWDKYAWSWDAFGVPLSTIGTLDHTLHKHRRAPLNQYLSKAKVASRRSIISTKVAKLSDRIRALAKSKTPFNLGSALSATATDVATEFILGKSYDNLDRNDFNEHMANMLQGSGGMWRVTKHVPFIGPLMKALPLSWLEKTGDPDVIAFVAYLRTSHVQTRQLVADFQDNLASASQSPQNLVHAILQSESLSPSDKELNRVTDEIDTVTGAGFETVAQTLRVIIYHIYSNASQLQELRTELRANIAPESRASPDLVQIEHLPHLTSAIKESLRLSPGLATRLSRIAPDRELLYAEKFVIPAGTPIGMTTLLMHKDERVFEDASAFKPERWRAKNRDDLAILDRCFGPFSRGTRICPGQHLAWAEMYLVLATLILNFDFDFVDVTADQFEPNSDQFIIGTKGKSRLMVYARLCQD